MKKFQAKYETSVDFDALDKKTFPTDFSYYPGGGRKYAGAQRIIRMERQKATVLLSRNKIQVYWEEPWQNIDQIESILEGILEPKPTKSLKSQRISVPTILESQFLNAFLMENLELQKESSEQSNKITELRMLLNLVQAKSKEYSDRGIKPIVNLSQGKETKQTQQQIMDKAFKLLSST